MSFNIYADEFLSKPLNMVAFSTFLDEQQKKQGVFYFGSPNDLIELVSKSDNIRIYPVMQLPEIERETEYALTKNNDFIQMGYTYRLIQGGITAAEPPVYPLVLGAEIKDGTALFKCVSKAHNVKELKLSLSEKQLETAVAGAGVRLGKELTGGTAIAIYYELTNSVDNVFNDFQTPQLGVEINECIEKSIEPKNDR